MYLFHGENNNNKKKLRLLKHAALDKDCADTKWGIMNSDENTEVSWTSVIKLRLPVIVKWYYTYSNPLHKHTTHS